MKRVILSSFILALSFLMSASAFASGCMGGEWHQVSKKITGQRTIQPIRGNSEMSAQVFRHYAKVTYSGVQFSDEAGHGKEIEFISPVFDPDKIHVPELFRRLEALPLKFDVDVVETIETNPYYDDCADIPENTRRRKITYEFTIISPNRKILRFGAFGEIRDTPPE